jgi:formate/nitrite transporter FocA (FNT family)
MFLSLFASMQVDPVMVAGIGMWAMTLYFSLSGLRHRITESLESGLVKLSKPVFPSTEPTAKRVEESVSLMFWASILGILPFVGLGMVCYFGFAWALGESWGVSFGLMGVLASGVYALGRSSSESLD